MDKQQRATGAQQAMPTGTDTGITVWLTIQSLVIIAASLLSFLFVILSARFFFDGGPATVGYAFGCILPLAALLGALNYFLSKNTMKYVTTLVAAIQQVADGDFSVRLGEEKAHVFSSVNKNFNKMCAELEHVQVLRSDFINSYSHEFKTPIVSINGFAQLLLEQEVSEEERIRYLRIIAEESARLADLANSTLLLARLESREIVEDPVPFSLDEQLKRCAIALAPKWNEKQLDLTCDTEAVTFSGDPQLTGHIWTNLLGNAIKFTPAGGAVRLSLRREGQTAVATVADTGKGMSPEVMARIFEQYFQGDASHAQQGMGLGLSIARRAVALCGGTITVDSREGEGSIFTVTLPLDAS